MEGGKLAKAAIAALALSSCAYDAPDSPVCMASCDVDTFCNDGGYRFVRCMSEQWDNMGYQRPNPPVKFRLSGSPSG